VRICGVGIDPLTLDQALQRLTALAGSAGGHYVCFCESHLCYQATRQPAVRQVLEQASLVLADGVSMTVLSRLIGRRLPERLPGPTMMLQFCRHGVDKGLRHFFVGGAEGVADALARRLVDEIPRLQVAGTWSPPFRPMTPEEDEALQQRLREARVDVLWVGLGAPKQEFWMAQRVGRLDVPLMLGVGAAFDFHSGARRWAPRWVRRAGLEWLFRMFTGGRRVFFRNASFLPGFVWMAINQILARQQDRLE